MEEELPRQKRQTIRIRIPPKPAAPRTVAVAIAHPIPQPEPPAQPRNDGLLFPIAQIVIASGLASMILDGGQAFQMVCYAATAYAAGLLMMSPRRNRLTRVDGLFVRWGFLLLCVISLHLSQVIWSLRGFR
jgi:hypothetical protein